MSCMLSISCARQPNLDPDADSAFHSHFDAHIDTCVILAFLFLKVALLTRWFRFFRWNPARYPGSSTPQSQINHGTFVSAFSRLD